MQLTLEQVHDIVSSKGKNQNIRIALFSKLDSTSYSYTTAWTSYHITLFDADTSYLLLVSPLAANVTHHGPITLTALAKLLSNIDHQTAVPVPRPLAHNVSGDDGRWTFGWLLLLLPASSSHPSTTLASVRDRLSPGRRARVERTLGTYLRALHGITNDWFGVPVDNLAPEPLAVPSFATLMAASQDGEEGDMTQYSWQDTFVSQLEALIDRVCGNGMVEVDVGEVRRCLFRAMGSFLFDDVEMPRLIWVTGNEEDVVVSLRQDGDGEDMAEIAYILPTFGRALWGDPLMEAWFMAPGPSGAIHEGYFEGEEDGTLIVFPRHNTKRTWYTVYLALLVLGEGPEREATRWARRILPECVEILKDAPCY